MRLDIEYIKKCQNQIEDMIVRGVTRQLSKKKRCMTIKVLFILYITMKFYNQNLVQHLCALYSILRHHIWDRKGPDILSGLLGILFRFRQKTEIAGDISKTYHTVKLNTLDQHTHRFVW